MSSYDAKSELGGGNEMQNLTLQWGYQQSRAAPSRQRIDWDERSELGRNILSFLYRVINKVIMLAGFSTTLIALAAVAWMNDLLVF
jgi:hypothetical protein